MNNKGFICEKTGTKMIAIREEDLDTLLNDLAECMVMVQSLAALSQKEEKLRQHHRPYLDVRKELLETGEMYLERIEEMDKKTEEMPYGCDLECFQSRKTNEEAFMEFLDEMEKECKALYAEAMQEGEYIPGGEDLPEDCEVYEAEECEEEDFESNDFESDGLTLLDDMMALVEYLDVQEHFIKLLAYGVPVEDEAAAYNQRIMEDVERMFSHWEQYIHRVLGREE